MEETKEIKKNQPPVDFRVIRYRGLNKIITTGWATLVTVLLFPFYIYALITTEGSERFVIALLYPFGIIVVSVVSAQLVVLITFIGLR